MVELEAYELAYTIKDETVKEIKMLTEKEIQEAARHIDAALTKLKTDALLALSSSNELKREINEVYDNVKALSGRLTNYATFLEGSTNPSPEECSHLLKSTIHNLKMEALHAESILDDLDNIIIKYRGDIL